MIFYDEEHEEMFNKLCGKMPYLDGYHLSLAYLLTMDALFCVIILAHCMTLKRRDYFRGLEQAFSDAYELEKTTRLAFNL